ncbi:MAG: hypothetical protein R3D30_08175 [Hyphomicrobiales bacterium]
MEELEDAGHRVLAAGNVEGLAAIKAGNPDVIISDVGMLVMDGYQLRSGWRAVRVSVDAVFLRLWR